MEDGYSYCSNRWALDKDIKNELGLLLIISSLCAEKGYCYASNKYLSDLFGISEISISRKIKLLEEKNYISIEYEKRGCEVVKRNIRLTKMLTDDYQNCKSTINKNVKENNTSINNTSINNTTTDTIFDFLQENGFVLTPIQLEVVSGWEDNELTRHAIKQAVLNNKFNINYIDKILYSYQKDNIKTVQQAIAREEEFNNRRDYYYKNKYIDYKKEQEVPEWMTQDLGKGGFIDDDEDF